MKVQEQPPVATDTFNESNDANDLQPPFEIDHGIVWPTVTVFPKRIVNLFKQLQHSTNALDKFHVDAMKPKRVWLLSYASFDKSHTQTC